MNSSLPGDTESPPTAVDEKKPPPMEQDEAAQGATEVAEAIQSEMDSDSVGHQGPHSPQADAATVPPTARTSGNAIADKDRSQTLEPTYEVPSSTAADLGAASNTTQGDEGGGTGTDDGGGIAQHKRLESVSFWTAIVIFASFPVILLVLLASLVFLFVVISSKSPNSTGISTAEKMALAASVQVAIGMVMGFISVFIGLMMTWFGINAAYEFTSKAGQHGEASLKSASPGLLFFLGGIILVGVSLYKPITYQEPGDFTKVPVDNSGKVAEQKPNPLPSLENASP